MAIEINNLETYLEEEEKIKLSDGNFIEIRKESFGNGPDHSCGYPTFLVKRTAYNLGKKLSPVCDIAYCPKCNEGEQIE